VFGERHLRHVLLSYMKYHNEIRTHLSLEKDAPVSRAVKLAGTILCRPVLGGLHHQYVRIRFTTGTRFPDFKLWNNAPTHDLTRER
jgi:hypothetical protein